MIIAQPNVHVYYNVIAISYMFMHPLTHSYTSHMHVRIYVLTVVSHIKVMCIVLYTPYSYEQLAHIHPEIDDYKLYYAQVRMSNVCLVCVLCVCVVHVCVCVYVYAHIYACMCVYLYTMLIHK